MGMNKRQRKRHYAELKALRSFSRQAISEGMALVLEESEDGVKRVVFRGMDSHEKPTGTVSQPVYHKGMKPDYGYANFNAKATKKPKRKKTKKRTKQYHCGKLQRGLRTQNAGSLVVATAYTGESQTEDSVLWVHNNTKR